MNELLVVPPGALTEVTARRTATEKVWDMGGGVVTHRISNTPLHYNDRGTWLECDPSWVANAIATLPYKVQLLPTGIGFRLTDERGRDSTVRLLSLDGVPFSSLLLPVTASNVATWAVSASLTVSLVAQTWGLQFFKQLNDALAPKVFVWEASEPTDTSFTVPPLSGNDNMLRAARATRPIQRRLDLTQSVVVISDDGTTRVSQITEAWSGLTRRPDPANPGQVFIEADAIYPVLFDPTFSQTVSVGAEDGYEANNFWYGTQTFLYTRPSTPPSQPGIRFTNVTIAAGATVSSATLTIKVNATSVGYPGDPNVKVYGDDVDSGAAWSNTSRPSSGFTKTAHSSASTALDSTGTKVITITTPVQDVLGRAGWASGNNIRFGIFAAGNSFSFAKLDSQETASGAPATLDVTYTTGGAVTGELENAIFRPRLWVY